MKNKTLSPVATLFSPSRARALCLLVCASLLFASALFTCTASDQKRNKEAAAAAEVCEVENFGKVNQHYYRGAQPEADQYAQLAALGIKTVLDLRDDPKEYARARAQQAGLRYINLPMSDKRYPAEESVKKFLELARDNGNWPIYVHCAGGRHRTGAMIAVYRMTDEGWGVERAYEEMKDYDFYTRWGHKDMKRFVFDYAKDLQARRTRQAEATSIAPTIDNR